MDEMYGLRVVVSQLCGAIPVLVCAADVQITITGESTEGLSVTVHIHFNPPPLYHPPQHS